MVIGLRVVILRGRDLAKLIAFYRDGFGLEFEREIDGRMAMLKIPGGPTLELTASDKVPVLPLATDRLEAAQSIVFEVESMAAAIARLEQHGARVVNQPFALGPRQIAYIADPCGNVVGLSSMQ